MRKLSLISIPLIAFIAILMLGFISLDSPHGKNFNKECSECHTTGGWKMDPESKFDHNTTNFLLEGRHLEASCRQCHPTLIFAEASLNCNDCHTDIHEQSLGQDCERCHFPASWLVSNITNLHQNSRFPLVGAHLLADCYDCHKSESMLRFDPIGINCIDCHRETFIATTEPNHPEAGFSEQCEDCHLISAYEWSSSGFNHNFFPLTLGHDVQDCRECHILGDYASTSSECFVCHDKDYNEAANPDHVLSKFSKTCSDCHNTNPGWKPATFDHDPFFPIYSGKHNGEWNQCIDCHNDASNYSVFTCIDCHDHNKTDMDKEHDEEPDYRYNSPDCFDCHPKGIADD